MPKKKTIESNGYHHGDVENACIQAAFELLDEKGFHQLNIREVTKRVGISHNAPYRYFKSKEELFVVLIIRIYDEIIEVLDTVIDSSKGDIDEDYKKLVRSFVLFAMNNREKYRLLSFYTVQNPRSYPNLIQGAEKLFIKTHAVLAKYLRKFDKSEEDTVKFIVFCMSTIRGYATMVVENKLELAYPEQQVVVSNDEYLNFIIQELVRLTKLKNCPE